MEVIELFEELLRFPTITPRECGSLNFIREYLPDYEALWFEKEGVRNLFLYRKFGEGDHLCFGGHIDVVPPGEGWESDPFQPRWEGEYIYGRGAQDMKSGVAASLQALKEVESFNGTLSLLITSDEEGEARWGTRYVLEELEPLGLIPDYAIVAEPTCESTFGDTIKIGRRGSINGVIEKIGVQGHAAYPEKAVNPIHKVAQVLPQMAGVDLDEGDEFFAPSKFVITDIRAGMEVTNVTPGTLKMMFNVRNNRKTTMEDVEAFVHSYFDGMNYSLKLTESARPFLTDPNSKVVRTIDRAIEEVTSIRPSHSTAGGTSDARFFAAHGVKTIEFGVINDRIHAPNERTTRGEVEGLCRVFKRTIELFSEGGR
ncbi:MAG: succinyl-diaminopimelate desuccinylase [Epsilonproteobacteria bacterium]|nr:succinyl-diaminopimelate desuccinylase [Campylobacterota bacterium]NPA56587.1 succinyl-diaminopimelate desuccinylase [Campylobacterota bacterium]